MAFIFSDSFDFYTVVASSPTDLTYGGWSSVNTPSRMGISSAITRFGVGKSLVFNDFVCSVGKTFASNTSNTIFINISYYDTRVIVGSTSADAYCTFGDGVTSQFTISFMQNGSIQLRKGGTAGAVVATYLAAYVINEWNNFQFKIKIGKSKRADHVRETCIHKE